MDDKVDAIIRVKVPKWQIGEEVSVYFPDTMTTRGKCEMMPPQVDLISRNALIQHAYSAVVDGVEKDIIDLSDVDNAPIVPLPDFKEGYKQAIIDGKTNFSRPQGELVWSTEHQAWTCTHCGGYFGEIDNKNIFLYCPNCGADMRKGGAE